jgi:DNA-damage-inducible protein D
MKIFDLMNETNPIEDQFPNNNRFSFEDFKNEIGDFSFWWATDLMKMLGYKDLKTFQKAIDRAITSCMTINIPHYENFVSEQRDIDGSKQQDFKLTRFACYMVVMNADPKKVEVASAQVYFAEQTRKFELVVEKQEDFERLIIRNEVKEGNKSLTSTAKAAGVTDYARFANAGYTGLYNMLNIELAKKRRIDPKELIEYMGRTELAANLFRITQTEEKIKSKRINGQQNLEQTHFQVGREVRNMIQKNTGKTPEQLPIEQKLPDVQKGIKKGYKNMLKEDKSKKK